ncbi:MAG: phospho-sugar mutase [Defluviitaleaceae bacterium]|nr:phospho-sugar mutase [Defluviitaleaceae bacterium]MCL2835797.1 phospho-sugar mutase [Defluviitaleaceae bacterium]
MDYRNVYTRWLEDAYFDDETRKELREIAENEKDIEERFYKNLDFGTGGLRGVIGAGTNRMNIYTVRKATQGLANYILKHAPDGRERGVAIAYDSRRFSKEFAETAALTLCGNGIKAFVFEGLRPTPELSFTVRHLNCIAGIVVTASHNPPEYNGYKVYWEDGGQVKEPRDQEIIDEVNNVSDFSAIRVIDMESAAESGLFVSIGKEVDDAFMREVMAHSKKRKLIKEMANDFGIIYTPFNGAGNVLVRRALAEVGFTRVYVPAEQELPDPDFTTIGFPNPENPKTFDLAIKLLIEKNADIAVATDPDSDRVGVVIRKNGETVYFSGNVIGVLLTEFLLSELSANGNLPDNASITSTIVSTDMTKAVCKAHNTAYYEVLTGFKYIAGKIGEFERSGKHSPIMGFEESIGYLIGTHSRDKDAVTATLLICEMAASYKKRGMDLQDGIMELYEKYGYYRETTINISMPGLDGLAKIKAVMARLRQDPVTAINGVDIIERRDYLTQEVKTAAGTTSTGLPLSDVLYYVLEDGSWFCVRPSGTEPKIKVYLGVREDTLEAADKALSVFTDGVNNAIAIV